jgi:ribose-phosphate pyrophosphokinase
VFDRRRDACFNPPHGRTARPVRDARPSGASRVKRAARVHVFPDDAPFGGRLARAAGLTVGRVAVHRFPDGESLVRVDHPRGADAVLVRSLHDPNAKLVETVLAADALRRAGAPRVTLVAPYLPYMRQDTVFAAGQPVSQRVVGAWLGRSFDRVLTVEPHLHRTARLAGVVRGGRSVSAAPALAAWIARVAPGALVVGPDEESAPCVRAVARAAGLPWAVGRKQRLGDHRVRIRFAGLPAGGHAVVVDDIASTGGTLAMAAQALRAGGVGRIDALVVHAIFAPGAVTRVRRAGIRRLCSCDTVPHATNAIGTASVLAAAL